MVKTYSHKRRLDVKLIEDVHQRCRLCLMRAEVTVPIFQRADDMCAALPLRIMSCVGFEIVQEDCLPNLICTLCHHELERYYKFRKKCEKSYLKLKAHFKAIKENEKVTPVKYEIFNEIDQIIEPEKIVGDTNADKRVQYEICNEINEIIEPEELVKVVEDPNVDELAQLVIADVREIEEQKECQESNANIVSVSTTNAEDNVEETTEIEVIQQHGEVSPDISSFLNAILVELGIVVKDEEGFVVHDQGVGSIELETGDDDHIVFELVEEDEGMDGEEAVTEESMTMSVPEETENVGDLTENVRKKYDKKDGAWCSTCCRQLSSASALRRHREVHAPARTRPHACPAPHCHRTFAQKSVMLRHRLLHAEERPFKCPVCPKSYTQRGALAAHARAHASGHARALSLHACALCDRLFLYASGLSRHMLTHTGRTFPCATCKRPFSDRSSLLRHTRNAHPTPPEVDPSKLPDIPSLARASSNRSSLLRHPRNAHSAPPEVDSKFPDIHSLAIVSSIPTDETMASEGLS